MPHEIAFDAAGHLYVAERDNHVVRKIDGRTGVMTTLAGTGAAGFSGTADRRHGRRCGSRTASRSGRTAGC